MNGAMAVITGNSGNNNLSGTSVSDTISGLAGNDTLIGGLGSDSLNGGEGSDTYQVGLGDGFDSYADTGTSGTDRIVSTADNVAIGLKSGFGPLKGIEEINSGG